jgi:hypothetical protein
MLGDGGALPSDQPGLFGALLIALAGGWAASRILRTPANAFHALELGFAGAVLGMLVVGVPGRTLNAIGLFAAAIVGGLTILGAGLLTARVRRRNLGRTDELENQDTQEGPS